MSESHPELCFELLNNGPLITLKKHFGNGRAHKIINKYINISFQEIRRFCKRMQIRQAKMDDIIDAVAVIECNALGNEREKTNYTRKKKKTH